MSKNLTQKNTAGSLCSPARQTPKLRFPGFDGVWEEKKIGQVLKIGSGKDYKHLKEGSIPVFGTGGYMLSVDKPLYSGESVMIGRKGTIDKPFYFNGDFWTVDTLFYTYDFNGILPKFTESIFKKINWQKYNEASGVPSLSKTTIEKIKINLPQLSEQQKIASFLKSVDGWLENLRTQKQNLEQYKKGIMQKIFSQEVRFSPARTAKQGGDKNGKVFPDWEEKKLGDIGGIKTSSVNKKTDKNERSIFLLNYMDVYRRDHIFSTDNFQEITAKDNQIDSCSLKKGDILFTPSSETPIDIGHSAVVMEDLPDVLFSYHLMRFRPNDDILNHLFSGYAFKSFGFYKKLWRLAQGATRFTLSLEAMKEVKVLIPRNLEEQQKIADFLTSVDKSIESKQQQITLAENWKKGLMQGLFV